ncbi:hypothetical protein K2F54_13460 [Cryobacterium sp. 1639]|uniref:lipopolysaccharide biosynthesis protein n=1 Tax=Cryobacterium inferilacus TaxID=2866629 RepID=UPI001C731B8A|nr:polysaccharide biosynthesis C-terminal domain-containing protein [Cryobacterium sp. 1639]MBX0300979.1 hypothetical protein [Cryobacterium sp. 1639]
MGFIVVPMLGAISPLIALPAITANFGAVAWGAIAIGQSIGMACAVVVELGWSLNGPQRVARSSPKNRNQTLAAALLTKALIFMPMALIAFVAAYMLAPTFKIEAAVVAMGSAAVGMSSTWYFIGTRRPGWILTIESLPKLVAVGLAALAMSLGAPLYSYALAVLAPSLLAPWLTVLATRLRLSDFRRYRPSRVLRVIQFQSLALSARAVSAVYIALPITLVGIAAPAAVPVFAAAERLQRMALTLLQSIPNFMQGWVGSANSASARLDRARKAIVINAAFGVVSGLVFALAAPRVAHIVFSGVIEIPLELSSLSGVLIFIVCTSRATGNIALVALNKVRVIMISAMAGALVGVPAIFLLSARYGPEGALIGELIAEGTVLVIQLVVTLRARRPPAVNLAVS